MEVGQQWCGRGQKEDRGPKGRKENLHWRILGISDFHKQFLSSSGVRSQIACSQGLRGGQEKEAACFCMQGALKEKSGTMWAMGQS